MINEKMRELGAKRSVIRELFEYSKARKMEIGEDNVFDFSIGNPSVPAPDCVNSAMTKLIKEENSVLLHGYTSAQGDTHVRQAVVDFINKTQNTCYSANSVYMTVGAAAALTCSLTALVNAGEEVIVLAPYFPEYKVFIERTGGIVKEVLCNETTFQPDFERLEKAINEKTSAIIVNSPNNPTGAVITEENIVKLSALLNKYQQKFGKPIYIICDEPYRELVYGDVTVPFIPKYYDNTIVCYSFSKSLSIPGERIGYVLVPEKAQDNIAIYQAVCGAGRALGFVCAPSLLQKIIPLCIGQTADISIYDKNRQLLLKELTSYGYSVVKPDGAFYLFVKSPSGDGNEFSERAKKHEIMLVPSDSFGCKGYVRLSYCVTTEQIEKALPAFKNLAKSYGITK
ncbi:MAG: pyridoxal phosphate-dependent aminotransferase [Clostridia bacterium]|nr:pyridoxal phosphate-dependent aminotransferase [Clostridia bacterium]